VYPLVYHLSCYDFQIQRFFRSKQNEDRSDSNSLTVSFEENEKSIPSTLHDNWHPSPKTLKYSMLVASYIMPTAYILVNCTLGSEEKIINEIAKLPDVKEVRGTYGVHDIFVKVKSDNTETMNHTITNKIRKVSGITSTVTLVVIEEQGGKGNT
jgi:DNA-binding Lrp family transcriptional regulator